MELPQIILATIAIIASLGGASAWFARNRGTSTVKLLQANIDAYKDSETLKDARIKYLEGQVVAKDETITNLNDLLKKRKR